MGVAALTLGLGAVASAGIGAYSAHQAGGAAQDAASAASSQYREAAEAASGRLARYENMIKDPATILGNTLKTNFDYLPATKAFSKRVNTFNTKELGRMLNMSIPGYKGALQQAMANTSSWIRGELPNDVSAAVQDRAAENAIRMGLPAGSAAARALTSRDLGLTSLNLMQTGENSLQKWISTAKTYLTPEMVGPMNFLLTPERYTNLVSAGAGIANQRAQIEMGGANQATQSFLQGESAKIAADQAMWQSIAQGIEGVTGSMAGGGMPTGGGTGTGTGGGGWKANARLAQSTYG